jgi:hypothetical protein
LFKIALGEHDGETKIFSDPAGYSASILPTQPSEHLHEEIVVTLNRLDTIVAKNGLAAPEVLKLDVQGAELGVLRGAGELLGQIKVIQSEVWFKRAYGEKTPLFHEVYDFLAQFGFSLMEFGGPFYNANRELYCCEAYFVQSRVLGSLAANLPKEPLTIATNSSLAESKLRWLRSLFHRY